MRKTPSYLKGLAETRARAAADVLRYKQLINEIMGSLAKAQAELEACDTLIKKFDERLDPALIEPVLHWKGRYGKRGALREAVLVLLQERAPAAVPTPEICWAMQLKFRIGFSHWKERDNWRRNSVLSCLKKLVKEGLAEACHDPRTSGKAGSWRVPEK